MSMNLDCKQKLLLALEIPLGLLGDKQIEGVRDFDFAITTVALKSPEYLEVHKKENRGGRYLALDSGAFEEPEPIDNNSFLDMAEELQADELVVPDFIRNADRTMEVMDDFLSKFRKRDKLRGCKIQGVIEGETLKRLMECYDYFLSLDEVDVIGLPYWRMPDGTDAEEGCFGDMSGLGVRRLYFLHRMVTERKAMCKPFHLLGLCFSQALNFYRNYPNVRSLDTSLPITVALKEETLNFQTQKPKEKLDYLLTDISRNQRWAALYNSNFLSGLCRRF